MAHQPERERGRGRETFTTRKGEEADSRIRPDNGSCMVREAEPVMQVLQDNHISIVNLADTGNVYL